MSGKYSPLKEQALTIKVCALPCNDLMYRRYAPLHHLPIALMVAGSQPIANRAEAPPILQATSEQSLDAGRVAQHEGCQSRTRRLRAAAQADRLRRERAGKQASYVQASDMGGSQARERF